MFFAKQQPATRSLTRIRENLPDESQRSNGDNYRANDREKVEIRPGRIESNGMRTRNAGILEYLFDGRSLADVIARN